MAKRIKIEFLSNPVPVLNIGIQVLYGTNSSFVGVSFPVAVEIGATKEDTASKLFDWFDIYPYLSWQTAIQTITLDSNKIYFDYDVVDESNLSFPILDSNQSAVTVEEVDVVVEAPYEIGLVRSTLSVRLIPNVNFDNATLDLYNWTGRLMGYPIDPTLSLSKPVVQLGQNVINFDINEIVKTNITPTIANYTQSGLQPTPFNQNCWTYYNANCYDGLDLVYNKTGSFLSVYGYGYFQDSYNPKPTSNILIDGNSHTHIRGYDNRIHFITYGLTAMDVNESSVVVDLDLDYNYNNIASINLNDYDATDELITVSFYYDGETRQVVFKVKDECKYEVVNCVFINKYGVPQSLFFTKAQKRSDEIESSEYRGLVSDFGVYNTTSHTYKTFNSNGRSKVSCNSDYLNDTDNEKFRQMMLSESIWLIESGVINPVTIDKKSIEYKTSLVDKLIQYTIDFKYSFDIINQC